MYFYNITAIVAVLHVLRFIYRQYKYIIYKYLN